jgi:hypothetical protein
VSAAQVRTDAPVVAGARLTLAVASKAAEGTHYHWAQTFGPAVTIDDPTAPSIRVLIPQGAESLGFVVVMARADLVRVVRMNVPIQGDAARASWGAQTSSRVRADAGDDQVGLVGHRVTLNGARSMPADGKSARWLQVAGPPVVAPQNQGHYFSFVPASPGIYRFLLVVAAGDEVSEPDEVVVQAGTPPPATPTNAGMVPSMGATAGAQPAQIPAQAPTAMQVPASVRPFGPSPNQILAAALPRLPEPARVLSEIADVMEAIAERAGLYSSFAVLQSELARRLDLIIPAVQAERAVWNESVFAPLTIYTTQELLATGLDVRQPQGLRQPLSTVQRERLREHFLMLARSFRAVLATR